MKRRCFHGFFSLLISISINVPAQQILFKTFSFQEGLNTYGINKTLQDNFGFIWVATQDGLYRFDGRSFEGLKHEPDNANSPAGNFFFDVHAVPGGPLYAADFNQGIDIIDPSSLAVKHQKFDVGFAGNTQLPNLWLKKIFVDRLNTQWIGGKGFLAIKQFSQPNFETFTTLPGMSERLDIRFIRAASKNQICVGVANYGLVIFNIRTRKIERIHRQLFATVSHHTSDISDIWIEKDTVYAIDNSGIIKGNFMDSGWKPLAKYVFPNAFSNSINSFVRDKDANFWIGTNAGLFKYNTGSNTLVNYLVDRSKNRWLQDNTINHLMIDRENNLWISTSKALQMISLNHTGFRAYSGEGDKSASMDHLYALVPKNEREIYSTATDGIYLTDLANGITKRIPGSSDLGIVHYMHKIQEDLWIVSCDLGMFSYIPSTGTLSQSDLISKYPEWAKYRRRYFNASYHIGNISYWASEEDEGLFKWNIDNHTITQYKAGTTRSGGLIENHIHNIKSDGQGVVWLLTDNTIQKFDPKKDSVVSVLKDIRNKNTTNEGIFFDMYDDGQSLWFGSYGGGLNRYHKSSKQWTQITANEGLCNNSVYGILPESDSVLWVSTNMGVSKVNTNSSICSNYYYEDGLQDNSFDEKGYLQVGKKLYFGGINGFTEIVPDSVQRNLSAFPAYIRKLVFYQDGEQRTINKLDWKEITLPAGTTTVMIYVSALSYTNTQNIKFSYAIKNLQDEYIDVNENVISLNALSNGLYDLEIRYRNKDGSFINSPLRLGIEILPKWYQSIWFKVLVIVSTLGLVYSLYHYRIEQIRQREKMRKQISNDLHDDVGSTLNSIKVFSNLAILESDNNQYLPMIKDGVQAAISSTRDLMWVLDDKQDSLSDLFYKFEEFATLLAKLKSVDLKKILDDELTGFELTKEEKRNLYLILKESFTNSMKYSECSTFTYKATKAKKKKIELLITDDGAGFHVGTKSSGNGLKNMEYRASQIGFSISIVSCIGKGTTIHLAQS